MFAFVLLFFCFEVHEANQGRVRSAFVKGNVPSIIHAPPGEESYHSMRTLFASLAESMGGEKVGDLRGASLLKAGPGHHRPERSGGA